MKNSTFLKGLFATSLACFCMSMPAWAQEDGGDETTPTTVKVYQMTDQITSGKSYVIGVLTDQGWYVASAPWGWGGLFLCQMKVETDDNNDGLQIRPTEYDLPVFVITEEDKGYTLVAQEGVYIGAEKPAGSDDGKDDGKGETKDDGKDDGKDDVITGVFLNNSTLTEDSYWDIVYDDELEGFTMKNKATAMEVGLDVMMYPSGDGITYDYRLAPFVDLTEEYKVPLYLFEMSEQVAGIGGMEYDQVNAPKYVYNLSGMMVGKSTEGLNPGIYVVKQGQSVKKVVVD